MSARTKKQKEVYVWLRPVLQGGVFVALVVVTLPLFNATFPSHQENIQSIPRAVQGATINVEEVATITPTPTVWKESALDGR